MRRPLLIASFSLFALLLAACGGSATATPTRVPAQAATATPTQVPTATPTASRAATPTATSEAVMVPEGDISTLLQPDDFADVAGVTGLTTEQRDMKAMAGAIDPTQVEDMDSFDLLDFASSAGPSLSLITIDFTSEGAATDHLALVSSDGPGMEALTPTIGDSSVFFEVNTAGVGSAVVFKKGEWVVQLHTVQRTGAEPLVDLAELTALARLVAGRL